MIKQKFDINNLRVASPCSVGWETMSGDERKRFCQLCSLNVYNISGMTKKEACDLIAGREGRLCIRFYRRADGTVLTKDCPVGLRAYYKRTARFAGAALAAILGLFSVSFGQKDKKAIDAAEAKIVRTVSQKSVLTGIVFDPNGAIVPGAEITIAGKNKKFKTKSDADGNFSFPGLLPGVYKLEAVYPGFARYKVKNLTINEREESRIEIMLDVYIDSTTMGIFTAAAEPVDTPSGEAAAKNLIVN